MAKQKPKKKHTSISDLDRAFLKAANLPLLSAGETHQKIQEYRKRAKKFQATMGFQESLTALSASTPEALYHVHRLQQRSNIREYMVRATEMILSTWYGHKIVYRISAETAAFLLEHQFDQYPVSAYTVFREMCEEPIYLEFPDDEILHGAFIGLCSLQNEAIPDLGPSYPVTFFVNTIFSDKSELEVHKLHDLTIKQQVEGDIGQDHSDGTAYKIPMRKLIMASMAYLYLSKQLEGASDRLLLEKPRSGCHTCIEVQPMDPSIPAPNYGTPGWWFSTGLCYFFGKQTSEEFRTYLTGQLDEMKDIQDIPVFYGQGLKSGSLRSVYLQMKTYLEWEEHRIVYQYDEETLKKLRDHYLPSLYEEGFPSRLLEYLPYSTLMLHEKNCDNMFHLVTTSKTMPDEKPGVCITFLGSIKSQTNLVEYVFPTDLAKWKPNKAIDERECDEEGWSRMTNMQNFFLDALVCTYHILATIERLTRKRMAKQAATKSRKPDPEESLLQDEQTASVCEDNNYIRYASPLTMFDLTARTVKRVREKEIARRSGYKMVPHHRRRHAHRYWVGSGAEKHLEVRWIEDIHVNKTDDTSHRTTIQPLQ